MKRLLYRPRARRSAKPIAARSTARPGWSSRRLSCAPCWQTERETRYYLTSSPWRAERLGPMVRDHWAVENGLHWVMDMTFRDDECRIRTDHAPENFVALKPSR